MMIVRPIHRCLFALLGLCATALSARDPLPGQWSGAVEMGEVPLKVQLVLEEPAAESDTWTGAVSIPAQMVRGLRLGGVAVADGDISFGLVDLPDTPVFEGTVGEDGRTIEGLYSQGDRSFPFRLEYLPEGPARDQVPARGIPGTGLEGHWFGALRAGPQELRLVLHFVADAENRLQATLDVLDQGVSGVPIARFDASRNGLRFSIPAIQIGFDGRLSVDGSELRGQWTLGGQALPLTFKRVAEAPRLVRPQEPSGPLPYTVTDVRFANAEAGIELAGTLTIPSGPGPHPAAVLLSGSGPQDRDETVQGHRPFLVLADHLTRHGIAVLRFDNRGVGASGGDFASATHEDFASDGQAAFRYLQDLDGIDPARVGLVAHSEGGAHAQMVAVRETDVAYIVSMAGIGLPIGEIIELQQEELRRLTGVAHLTNDDERTLTRQMFELLREEGATPAVRERVREMMRQALAAYSPAERQALRISEGMMEQQLEMLFSPWFVKLLAHDPRKVLEAVECPVLAMNGDKDVQVPARENLAGIRQALEAGGNEDFTIVELPGLNHLFQRAVTGGVDEYARIAETINPSALQMVSDWIIERMRP